MFCPAAAAPPCAPASVRAVLLLNVCELQHTAAPAEVCELQRAAAAAERV